MSPQNYTVLRCGVLRVGLGESQMTQEPKSKMFLPKQWVGGSKSVSPCESLNKTVMPGCRERLQEAPASSSSTPSLCQNRKEHLILAFFAGVLLTLLLMALIFIIKSCRKSYSSAQAQDPLSEPPIKLSSTSKESLTYASMTFKPSGENSNGLTGNHSTALDPTVYSEIKVADPSLPLQ
ncbi:Transmembrane protein C1orf162 homolog [Lemmus lemmus]